jgi:hypothetical protein
MAKAPAVSCSACDELFYGPEEACATCGLCDGCCSCETDDLFDADELGLDPEDDATRKYGDTDA